MTGPPDNRGAAGADTAGTREDTGNAGKPTATVASAQPRPRKWARVLGYLAVDGHSLNRFEAARELRDWCLNTTVSQLERRGVRILRREETVPGAFGPVHCCRYFLDPASRPRALELLEAAR